MNGHAGIDTLEATEHLKNILNVGKSETETVKSKPVSNGDMEGAGDSNLVLSNSPYQKIELNAEKDSYHSSIYGTEVDIYSSPLVYGATCSQIIVDNVVDFGWEEKYYSGRLIGVHLSGKYIAYVLKPSNLKSGYVRVLSLLSQKRHLIKVHESEVKDIAFAHSSSQILLGSVDAIGEFYVHQLSEGNDKLICNLILHIFRPDWVAVEYNHIIWCLYIPDDNEDDVDEDVSSLLVVTHSERAEIWNIQTIIKEHGEGSICIDNVKCGVQVISEHKSPISTATFSPDGTALAIGSVDGVVKFFQVNTLDKNVSPRCLHQWTPHGDKPLSSLYFLDNHKNHKPDAQFWKFAVTGAENNTELKVWSCETWACLQTIRIHANPNDNDLPILKAEMDLSSKYLILSDIKRKVILIFLIQQDLLSSSASVKSVSEFRVPFPVLSLSVSSVSCKKYPVVSGEDNSDEEEESEQVGDTHEDCEENGNKLIVKLFWIQTKTLQFCHITYSPKIESSLHSVGSVSSLSQDSFGFKDGLSDVSIDAKDLSNHMRDLDISLQKSLCADKLSISPQSSVPNITSLSSHINFSNCTEVLLTPDDFTSPSHSNLSAQSSFAHHEETKTTSSKCDSSPHISDGINSLPVEPNTMQRRKSSQHSATSSPSREVAEIMAPAKGLPLDEIVLETPTVKMQDGIETLGNSLSSFAISSAGVPRSQPDYHLKEWPEAPDPSKEYGISKRSESDMNNHSKNFISSESSTAQFNTDSNQIIYQFNNKFEELVRKIENLRELSNSQKTEIQKLQTEIKTLQDQQHNQIDPNLSNKLDLVITQHVVPSYARIEKLIVKSFEDEQIQREQRLAVMTSTISSNCGNRMDNTLKQELSGSILPHVNRFLDNMGQKMQMDFIQKLGATEASVKETINKHLKGKAFVDSLSQSISSSLQSAIQTACKEVFQSSVIPAFEKSCQHLFHQLNELFQKGTQDYMQVIEKNSTSACTLLESITSQFKDEICNFAATKQAICNQLIQVENKSIEMVKKQETLMANLRHIIHEEVLRAVKEEASAFNSRSVTPVPHNDPALKKQLLIQLVKSGNINEAFQQALSAMDVQLVIFLCENVNVDQIFGVSPCPLQQHVLLSLVNQLSSDLSVKTDIKVRYIEDVITSLDSTDPIIKDHIHSVLENLQQRITTFLQKYPNHKYSRNLKRTSLAVISIIKGENWEN